MIWSIFCFNYPKEIKKQKELNLLFLNERKLFKLIVIY
jgi:hypothetical protein